MKKSILSLVLLLAGSANAVMAQLPENAEDISPLLIGETFPDVAVASGNGDLVPFSTIFKQQKSVVIFYRGGWCPYCNAHLAELGKNEAGVLKLGYQIVAVSPDDAKEFPATVEKDSIHYKLYSDASGNLAKAVGVAFKAPERYLQRLSDRSEGKNTGYLPVPSVFVLGTNGEVLFEYINPDYKKRLSAGMLLAVLTALNEEEE